jgi:hypothetical protein
MNEESGAIGLINLFFYREGGRIGNRSFQWPVALLTFGQELDKKTKNAFRSVLYTVCPSTLGLLEKVIVDDG